MGNVRILSDHDVGQLITVRLAIPVIEHALRAKASGHLVAPPRFQVKGDQGALVFTAGGIQRESLGFRVSATFPGNPSDHAQFVMVFNDQTGVFEGMISGRLLGAMRTGALGGLAVKHLARPDATTVGILGAGLQAETQLAAVAAVRNLSSAKVFTRSKENRERFARQMSQTLKLNVQAVASPRDAVSGADILLTATTSRSPVVQGDWIQPGVHINSLGPKVQGAAELPIEVAERSAVIAADSLDQVNEYSPPFFLDGTVPRVRMIELSDLVTGRAAGRASPEDVTLFCSVGLAGTEVVLAREVLWRATR